MEFPSDTPSEQLQLQYDSKWLAILKMTHILDHPLHGLNPPPEVLEGIPTDEDVKFIENRYELLYKRRDMVIPENFVQSQPIHNPDNPHVEPNPPSFSQTNELMQLLGVDNIFHNPPNVSDFTNAQHDSENPKGTQMAAQQQTNLNNTENQ